MSLIPPSSSPMEKAMEEVGLALLDLPLTDLTILPFKAKASLLPYLARMFDVDISGLEEDEQRQLLSRAFELHRYVGTVWAVETAMATFFENAKLVEWFQREDKKAYRFDIKIPVLAERDYLLTQKKIEIFKKLIQKAKNVRSHLEHLILDFPPVRSDFICDGSMTLSLHLTVLPREEAHE